jgi:bifunctional non-homologous end joining protein LigD
VALEKYRAKRNFKQSPEPAGDAKIVAERARAAKGAKPRFFCVQKHLASHLHYDFRLEHNGVLLSWAVPKGPSLDPSTKRLAMAVEDHPIEYGTFEGVIPSGYGAGIVMLWDRGTWTPEVDDVDAALKKGDLKITLDGFKLKGSWVLVRTKGRWAGSEDRSWLLIKHRDDWAGDVDIAEFAPLSVKSKGDFADILAQGNPDIWISHRPAQGGEAGAMFEKIVRRALEMKGGAPTPAKKEETAAAKGARKPSLAAKGAKKASAPAKGAKRAKGAVKVAKKKTATDPKKKATKRTSS